MIEPSIKNLKAVVEELKKTEVSPIRERFSKTPNPEIGAIERLALQEREMKITETPLSDLIQEKMKLEKILQEINNLKGRICQKIEFIKTLERRKREIEKQSASLREENPNFLGEVEKKLDNLKVHIK